MSNYFEPGVWFVLVALVVAGGLIRWWLANVSHRDTFQTLFCARYSIGFAILLVALPIVAKWGLPGSLLGLFVLVNDATGRPSIQQFVLLTAGAFLTALMVTATYRVTTLNALARLNWTNAPQLAVARLDATPRPGGGHAPFAWCWFLLLGSWVPIWTAVFTVYECVHSNDDASRSPILAVFWALSRPVVGIIGGIALTALIVGLALLFQWWVIPDFVDCRVGLLPFEDRLPPLNRPSYALTVRLWGTLARLVNSPGYTELNPGGGTLIFRPGHAQLIAVMVFLLLFYLGLYLLGGPTPANPLHFWSSSIWYLLVIVIIAGFLLSGLTFAVDTYRVPPILVAAIIVTLLHLFSWNADHFFEILTANDKKSSVSLPEALADWQLPAGKQGGTLVIVAAAGGGIQAAAWTAKVLTGLDELFSDFSESVAVISSVSGGSVGSMYYVAQRGDRSNDPSKPMRLSETQRQDIVNLAEKSSLEASAWGFAFPDLMRFIFPPGILDPLTDRGMTIERDWQWNLRANGGFRDSLRDWGAAAKDGRKPIVAFNSTVANTGQHLVMSSALTDDGPGYRQFLSAYPPKSDLRIATGARLSATFSYVSPICRPYEKHSFGKNTMQKGPLGWRIADGGYFDNDGIVLATKWAVDILEDELARPLASPAGQQQSPRQRRFRNIIILRILAFPDSSDSDKREGSGPSNQNLLWEVLGPVFCLTAARGGAQVERSNWETNLLSSASESRLFELRKDQAKPIIAELAKIAPEQQPELDRISTLIDSQQLATSKVAESRELVQKTLGKIYGKKRQDRATAAAFTSENTDRGWMEDQDKVQKLILRPILHKPTLASDARANQAMVNIPVWSVVIRPPVIKGQPDPPLSWKLTPSQKKAISDYWKIVKRQICERKESDLEPLPKVDRAISPAQLRHFFTEDPKAARRSEIVSDESNSP